MAAANEQFVFELGEWPSARKINAALWALAVVTIKRQVIDMINSGMSREQVNAILNEELLPECNEWVRENRRSITRTIHGDAPTHTIN
jgi:hypothetical protein